MKNNFGRILSKRKYLVTALRRLALSHGNDKIFLRNSSNTVHLIDIEITKESDNVYQFIINNQETLFANTDNFMDTVFEYIPERRIKYIGYNAEQLYPPENQGNTHFGGNTNGINSDIQYLIKLK